MNIFDIPLDFHYNCNNVHICTLEVLSNSDELLQIPYLNSIIDFAKQDDANFLDSRISFCLIDKSIIKCFICLKKENIDNKENGIKITSIGFSSLSAIKGMLLQIVEDNSLVKNPYSYLWFEKTQEPFIQTDFISLGFNNVFNNIWIMNLPSKMETE